MSRLTAACGLVLLLAAATDGAAAPPCLPVTVTNPDGNYLVPGARGGIVYRRVGDLELKLDVWAPAARTPVPAVLVVHGGGFTSGSRVAFVGQLLETLTDAGYAWASLDYRLEGPARRKEALDDVREAVSFLRCRAPELGIDPDRLVLLGEDTGAWLALSLAHDRHAALAGAALVGGAFPEGPQEPAEAGTPGVPLRFVHGSDDREQPPAAVEAWCAARRTSGGRCELERVEGASHRAENWWPSQWGYKKRLVDWLRRVAPAPPLATPLAPRPLEELPDRLPPGLHKRLIYAPDEGLTLDAWLPGRAAGVRTTAIVVVHGGGWEAGDRVTYVAPLFEPLARAGFAWFSIDYRLTPAVRHPEQLADVRRAVAFVRREAVRFGIDPSRIVLVGESASGQMVTLLAADEPGLAGVVSFYGVYDLERMVTDASPRSLLVRLFGPQPLDDEARARLRAYSPLHRARAGMPPLLLIHGTAERLWEQGVVMAERLAALRTPHELVRLEGAPHGLENWEGRPEWMAYKDHLVQWIRALASRPRDEDGAAHRGAPVDAEGRRGI